MGNGAPKADITIYRHAEIPEILIVFPEVVDVDDWPKIGMLSFMPRKVDGL